ncbi:hypothetical protein KAR91_01260 [Candidatus Pacearchaeota archaeon]|nr:hypothetical protein [Candidatus Pacearchaeota archaeon]
MDIRNRASFRLIALFTVASMLFFLWTAKADIEESPSLAETFAGTYQPGLTAAECQHMISILEQFLIQSDNDYTSFRIKYRISLLHFKIGEFTQAKEQFREITEASACPDLVKLGSLNMIAQINRITGDYRSALDDFEKLIKCVEEKRAGLDRSPGVDLLLAGLIAKAEIHEMLGDYSAAISQYDRLISIVSQISDKKMLSEYIPFALDRKSQLLVVSGKHKQYMAVVNELVSAFGSYNRIGIIEFEKECFEFLWGHEVALDSTKEAFQAPSLLVLYLRKLENKTLSEGLLRTLETLCKKYEMSNQSVLLRYHYAWILDAIGHQEHAKDLLAEIGMSEHKVVEVAASVSGSASNILREYAKIQCSIILGERADYTDALNVLATVDRRNPDSHIVTLASSVNESIETLKRENIKNAEKQE